jgi:hypothetical protein
MKIKNLKNNSGYYILGLLLGVAVLAFLAVFFPRLGM